MSNLKFNFLLLFASVISILFSISSYHIETVINPDAICYLLSADAVSQSTWRSVTQICPQAHWPFYSLLIFSIADFISITSLHAAYLINGFFSMISVITFIALVREMGGSKRILWLAAFTILFFHEFNTIRQYIVRDHGFWAFYLLSIFCLLRYFRTQYLSYMTGFYISLILAALFRIEAGVFLLLLPIIASVGMTEFSYKKRFNCFVILYLPLLIGISILFIYLFYQPNAIHHLGRVNEIITQLKQGISLTLTHFETVKNQLAHYILKQDAIRNAGPLLLLALMVWYGFYIIISLSLGYALLITYGLIYYNKNNKNNLILISYIMINIAITFIYFTQQMFLSKRYLVALSLTLMLYIPFIIDQLLKEWKTKKSARIILSVSMIFIFISALSGLIQFGYSKKYIREAGDWLSQSVKKHETLYANDLQLMYYSNHYGLNIFKQLPVFLNQNILLKKNWQQYDYIALRINYHDKNDSVMLKAIQQSPQKILTNSRGDRIVIYHNIRESQ